MRRDFFLHEKTHTEISFGSPVVCENTIHT